MTERPNRVRRYWIEESDDGEFFEDYPEPAYNECELLVIDKAMIERAAKILRVFPIKPSDLPDEDCTELASVLLRAALEVDSNE